MIRYYTFDKAAFFDPNIEDNRLMVLIRAL